MKTKAIINAKIVLKDGIIDNGAVLYNDKIIKTGENLCTDGAEVTDLKGKYLLPGLVDIHIHGYKGYDVSDGDRDGIISMSKALTKNGVTSWCPTTMTVSEQEIQKALDVIGELKFKDYTGARILGANMEGPFINPKKKGAQSAEHIKAPNIDFVMKNKDNIRLLTIAPEQDDNEFIKYISENTDILISMGHTDATYEQACNGIENGARHITHLFNAMPPLNHREPGVIGAALENDSISCEMIADTFHISPHMFGVVNKLKGDKLVLITDCMRAGGMSDGDYTLGGQPVTVKGSQCRLSDGTIAGSVLKLNEAIRNYTKYADIPLYKGVYAASTAPAKAIGVDNIIGSIEVGKFADFAVADDELNIVKTIVGGLEV